MTSKQVAKINRERWNNKYGDPDSLRRTLGAFKGINDGLKGRPYWGLSSVGGKSAGRVQQRAAMIAKGKV